MAIENGPSVSQSDGSIFVISDTHLGHCDSLHTSLAAFLSWLRELEKSETKEETLRDGSTFEFRNPQTMIMLGDILELWDPRECNRVYILHHSYSIFHNLYELTCKKVYVLGNHDEFLYIYAGEFGDKSQGIFQVIPRHYPKNPDNFIQMGENKFFFIHGQQFDKLFCKLGFFSKLPTYWGMISGITQKIPGDGWPVVGFFFSFLALQIVGLLEAGLSLLPVMGFLAVPRVLTQIQDDIWKRVKNKVTDKPRYKDIQEIIDKKYYRKEKDIIKANVVVFGHTHVPEIRDFTSKLGKVFVNVGSWVEGRKDIAGNSFGYIDERGVYLFKWHDSEPRLEMLERYSVPT